MSFRAAVMSVVLALVLVLAGGNGWAQTPPTGKDQPADSSKDKGGNADNGKQQPPPLAGPAAPPPAAQPGLEFTKPLRRGSTILFRTAGLKVAKDNVSLKLGDRELVRVETQAADSVAFVVPASGDSAPALGWQRAVATVTDPSQKVIRTVELGLHDLKPDDRPFALNDVLPKVSYPKKGAYEVVLVGTGFSDRGDDHVVLINGRKVDICWEAASKATCGMLAAAATAPASAPGDAEPSSLPRPPVVSGKINSDRELVLSGLSKEMHGARPSIQLALGSGDPSVARTVVLSQLREALAPVLAAVATLALFGLVIVVIRRSGPTKTAEGFPIGPVAALFLDRETESFSLSRFQFFAWTAVAVFSYLFLAFARTLVQGRLDLPDIPSTLPGIISISAGTSITALGVTSFHGPKGTGSVRPSFADLVSTGGVIAADRFQFLTWTLVGVVSFLLVVLRSDPATVSALPALPEGFLYLSGISAFGYLGGKLARKPGPVIDSALVEPPKAFLPFKIALTGRNLSPVTVRLQGIDVASHLDPTKHPEHRLVLAKPSSDPADGTAANTLAIYLNSWDPWRKPTGGQAPANPPDPPRKLSLSIVNADGQSAETLLMLTADDEKKLEDAKKP